MTRLVIATPVDGCSVTGQVSAGYAIALAKLIKDNHGLDVLPAQITYSTDIVRARNRLAAMVLREMPDASHILWWDSDVVPHDLNVVRYMLNTGCAVIGAPYLRKMDYPVWAHRGSPPTEDDYTVGIQLVKSLGFGFTITSTEALRVLAESEHVRSYIDKRAEGPPHRVQGLFDLIYRTDEDGDVVQESEDCSFCWRCRDWGIPVSLYLGPGNLLSHIGHHAYRIRQ